LQGFPSTYLTSFYLPPADKAQLNAWIKQFPTLTVLEVDHIVQQLQQLLKQLTQAINLLLVFALSAGGLVLISAVYNSLDMRLYETALMRTLGAQRPLIRRAQLLEFGLLGSAAGLIAALASEAIVASLYLSVLHLDYQPQLLRGLGLILLGGSAVSLVGWLAVRHVVHQAPLPLLRQAY
jgi:putative ABC transport system permease protein